MRSKNIEQLLKDDRKSREYFNSLSEKLRAGLMAHGDGINNFSELKHFAEILKKEG